MSLSGWGRMTPPTRHEALVRAKSFMLIPPQERRLAMTRLGGKLSRRRYAVRVLSAVRHAIWSYS